MWITSLLKRVGLMAEVDTNDLIDADIENALYDHRKLAKELTDAVRKKTERTTKLREALADVRHQALAFAEFETAMRKDHRHDLPTI